MKKTYNVLIIEDHQIIIDTYIKALKQVGQSISNIDFKISQAMDCESAYNAIKTTSKKIFFDLIFLDIQLPISEKNKLYSGEDLGKTIKQFSPKSKIIVSTSTNDNTRLHTILKTINPEGFLVKNDIVFKDLIVTIKNIISNELYYSKTIINLMRKKTTNTIILDAYDIILLKEMTNSAKMNELMQILPLTKSAIDKRKRVLKEKFKINSNSDRDLVLEARKKGFI